MKPNTLVGIGIILSSTISASSIDAKVFDFTCGTIEFTVDFEKSTVSDTIDGTAYVDWQYDGDWVRWNVKDTDEFYGVNTRTGALILDGVVNDAGCRMGDTAVLATLPLSDGAYLRKAFIGLPEQKRMEIQSALAQAGYYSSNVDGKWGRGTEAAIKTYIAENQDEMPTADYTSPEGASNTLVGAMSHLGLNSCQNDECADEQYSTATPNTPVSDAAKSNAELRTHREIFESVRPSCRSLSETALAGEKARDWRELGGDRSLMYELEQSFDAFFNGDNDIFNRYLALSARYPDFPPLQFMIGYGYWERNDFEQALTWLSKAAFNGEPNSAYLIALISLNVVESGDSLKIDSSFPAGPVNLSVARQCLEASYSVDDFLIVHGVMHQAFFRQAAAQLLVPILLKQKGKLYSSPEKKNYSIEWAARPSDLDRAIEIINAMKSQPSNSCDLNCWNAYEAEAEQQLSEREIAATAAEEAKRRASELTESELNAIVGKCEGFITLKSICWSQSKSERARVLATKGYTCNSEPNLLGFEQLVCKSGNMRISIGEDSFIFNCENFNTCNYSFREVGDLLVKQGVVSDLDYGTRTVSDGVNTFYIEEFCTRGASGDALCVSNDMNLLGQKIVSVIVSKGAVGDLAPTFD